MTVFTLSVKTSGLQSDKLGQDQVHNAADRSLQLAGSATTSGAPHRTPQMFLPQYP